MLQNVHTFVLKTNPKSRNQPPIMQKHNGELVQYENWGQMLRDVQKKIGEPDITKIQMYHRIVIRWTTEPTWHIAKEVPELEVYIYDFWYIMARHIQEVQEATKDIALTPIEVATGLRQETFMNLRKILKIVQDKP